MNMWIRRAVLPLLAVAGLWPPGALDAAPLRVGADARGVYVGAAVDMNPFRNEAAYRTALGREFNMLVAENAMKFDAMHPSQNTYNFTAADELVAYAEANGMAVRGHVLVWHSQLPGWLTNGAFNRDQMIAIMQDHIQTVVGRYRGRIAAWDVVNEAISDNNGQPRDSVWRQRIGPDYIALAFQFARQADPGAKLYYNDYEAEGSGAKSDAVFNLVSGLRSQGVPIDGVGWQWHKINGSNATVTSAHVNNAARIANLGLELTITEADVRIQLPSTAAKLQQQANEYASLWSFCLNTPICRGVVTWGFTDKYSWVPNFAQGFGDALILNTTYQPKPAYTAIDQLLDGGTQQLPAVPTGLTATAGNAQVQLAWNASSGATSYNVKRSTTSGGPYTTITSPAGTSFLNTGLTNGTTYFYVVSAVNAIGQSANSAQVSATPQPGNFSLSITPASLTVNRSGTASATVTVTRSGGFAAQVCLSPLTGLPAGVSVSFNHPCTPPDTFTLTFSASSTAALATTNLTVTATGGGLSRTASLALTVANGGGGGAVTVTPVVTANGPWFNEEQVRITNTGTITALSVTIVVQRTPGVSFSGQYNTVGGQIQQGATSTSAAVTYQFTLAPGQTLGTGTGRTFAAQSSGTGTTHPTSGDTYTVTYTTGGQSFTRSGTF